VSLSFCHAFCSSSLLHTHTFFSDVSFFDISKTACNDEWTVTFDPAQTISESAGVTVTLGSATGTLKTTLTGTDVTSAVVQVLKDVSFVKGSDTLTIGTTAAIANSAFTTKITARYTNRGNGYAGSPNRGYDTGSQRKTCKNQDGFACQSGETNCKLSPVNQDTTFDSDGDPCSYCSKCFKKSNGDSCTWQEAIAGGRDADCRCGLAFTSDTGVVKSAADVHCTVNGDSGCHCPASQAEFTSSYSFGSKNLVECKSGNLLQGGNDNWWGKTWDTIFQKSDAAVTETSASGSGATCEFFFFFFFFFFIHNKGILINSLSFFLLQTKYLRTQDNFMLK
jgi:hypothetical protein